MLGACELIRSGAAFFHDMFYKLEWIERAVRDSGLKANLSFGVSALPGLGSYREYAAYAETEALRRRDVYKRQQIFLAVVRPPTTHTSGRTYWAAWRESSSSNSRDVYKRQG